MCQNLTPKEIAKIIKINGTHYLKKDPKKKPKKKLNEIFQMK